MKGIRGESMRLVLASFNNGKRAEVAGILSSVGVDLLSPVDFGLRSLPEETGQTFLDNAVIKAASVAVASGMMAVGDDSGLQVDALNGMPGVMSARFAGPTHDDAANNFRLLELLKGVPDRSAAFVCTAALLVPEMLARAAGGSVDGVELVRDHPGVPSGWTLFKATGRVEGRIIDEPRGSDGFGYDPLFFVDELGLTFAEIPRDRKNALSHRGEAFSRLIPLLARLGQAG